jgi:glycosyltransferase 2 family protein
MDVWRERLHPRRRHGSFMDLPTDRAHRGMPSWLPQALGYVLSAACLAWVLRGYPLNELIPSIRSLDWRWVILGVTLDLSVYVAHGCRWNTLLGPVARLRLWRTVQAIYIGLFANEVLPLRTGELIRCYLLAHWNDLRLSLVFASAALERMLDGFWMLITFLITAGFVHGIPTDLIILVQILGVLLVLGALALLWVLTQRKEAHAVFSESRSSATFRHIVEGLHLMGNVRTLSLTWLYSLVYLVLQIVSVFALMRAYGLDLSIWVAGGVLGIVRFATVVPNAPGNVGLFQAACVLALGLFDVEKNDAKTFSFIMFFALTLPLLIGGAIATARSGLNLAELKERAQRGVRGVHRAGDKG